MHDPLEDIVEKTKVGDMIAAGQLIEKIQNPIYKIALKYLWNPSDAQDATQEALLRIFTKISMFEGKSLFSTWAYRVAVNHFLNLKRKTNMELSFEEFEENLERGLGHNGNLEPEHDPALIHEVKIGCSQGMLQSLSDKQRIAYILGEILELDSYEGAQVMEISRVSFRQLLSRARRKISEFAKRVCGVTSKAARCNCSRQVKPAIKNGIIKPDNLLFTDIGKFEDNIKKIDQIIETSQFFRQSAMLDKSFDYVASIKGIFEPENIKVH